MKIDLVFFKHLVDTLDDLNKFKVSKSDGVNENKILIKQCREIIKIERYQEELNAIHEIEDGQDTEGDFTPSWQ